MAWADVTTVRIVQQMQSESRHLTLNYGKMYTIQLVNSN